MLNPEKDGKLEKTMADWAGEFKEVIEKKLFALTGDHDHFINAITAWLNILDEDLASSKPAKIENKMEKKPLKNPILNRMLMSCLELRETQIISKYETLQLGPILAYVDYYLTITSSHYLSIFQQALKDLIEATKKKEDPFKFKPADLASEYKEIVETSLLTLRGNHQDLIVALEGWLNIINDDLNSTHQTKIDNKTEEYSENYFDNPTLNKMQHFTYRLGNNSVISQQESWGLHLILQDSAFYINKTPQHLSILQRALENLITQTKQKKDPFKFKPAEDTKKNVTRQSVSRNTDNSTMESREAPASRRNAEQRPSSERRNPRQSNSRRKMGFTIANVLVTFLLVNSFLAPILVPLAYRFIDLPILDFMLRIGLPTVAVGVALSVADFIYCEKTGMNVFFTLLAKVGTAITNFRRSAGERSLRFLGANTIITFLMVFSVVAIGPLTLYFKGNNLSAVDFFMRDMFPFILGSIALVLADMICMEKTGMNIIFNVLAKSGTALANYNNSLLEQDNEVAPLLGERVENQSGLAPSPSATDYGTMARSLNSSVIVNINDNSADEIEEQATVVPPSSIPAPAPTNSNSNYENEYEISYERALQ